MFELSQEQPLMYSDDRSLTLTTHRIIYNTDTQKEQIMLEDYEGFEFTTAHIGSYKGLAIFFNGVTIVLILLTWPSFLNMGLSFVEILDRSSFLIPFVILSGISYHLYRLSRRYYIRLIGKFNFIEVRIRNPRHKSIKKFLERVKNESDAKKHGEFCLRHDPQPK
jgi:hypothetical protein